MGQSHAIVVVISGLEDKEAEKIFAARQSSSSPHFVRMAGFGW